VENDGASVHGPRPSEMRRGLGKARQQKMGYNSAYIRDIVENLVAKSGSLWAVSITVSVKFAIDWPCCCHGNENLGFYIEQSIHPSMFIRLIINNDVIVLSTAKGLDRHRVRQSIAYRPIYLVYFQTTVVYKIVDITNCG